MIIRTVYDCNSLSEKHHYTILLLAISWHKTLRHTSTLEILHIGSSKGSYQELFNHLGIQYIKTKPHPSASFSKLTNSFNGAIRGLERVLLVDSDVCFLQDLTELDEIPLDHIAGAMPGWPRVSLPHWELIEKDLGLPVLRQPHKEIHPREMYKSQLDPSYKIMIITNGIAWEKVAPEVFISWCEKK